MKPALLADAKKQSVAALALLAKAASVYTPALLAKAASVYTPALLADAVCKHRNQTENSLLCERALTREGVYFFISADPS